LGFSSSSFSIVLALSWSCDSYALRTLSISLYGSPSSSSSVCPLYNSAEGAFLIISSGSPRYSDRAYTSVLYRLPIGLMSCARSPYLVPYPSKSSDLLLAPTTSAVSVFEKL